MWFRDVRPLSLRARVALTLLAGLGITFVIAFLGLGGIVHQQMYAAALLGTQKRVQALADFAAANPGREHLANSMLEFRRDAHEDYFEIRDAGGRLLARSESSAGRDLALAADAAGTEAAEYDLRLPDGHFGVGMRRTITLPARDPRGHLDVRVAVETERMRAVERKLEVLRWTVAGLAMLAALIATLMAVQAGLAPLARLGRDAESIDPDGPRRELDIGPLPRELAAPAKRINLLLHRVFDSRDRERRFSRNVAHELRTPLTEMRVLSEVGSLSESADDAKRTFAEIDSVTAEMQQIVDALQMLARYESAHEFPQPEPVDLAAEVRHHVESASRDALKRHLTVACELPEERWVMVDSALLHRVIANLVGNAVAHAPEGSSVTVALGQAGPLQITNSAPHLQERDISRLRERFFTVRSGSDKGHAGLGLALATEIAQLSGLSLDLRLDDERRFVAILNGFNGIDA